MGLLEQRKQARDASANDGMKQSAIGQAQILEHQAQLARERGDDAAYADCLPAVALLHNAGAHEEAEALLDRIKATLAKPDADEAEAFIAANVPAGIRRKASGNRRPERA